MVSKDESDVNQPASTSAEGGIPSPGNTRHDRSVPSMAQTSTDGMLLVRARLRHQKISAQACDVIMELWRTGASKLYRMSLDKWRNFARTKNENPIYSTVAKVIVLSF